MTAPLRATLDPDQLEAATECLLREIHHVDPGFDARVAPFLA